LHVVRRDDGVRVMTTPGSYSVAQVIELLQKVPEDKRHFPVQLAGCDCFGACHSMSINEDDVTLNRGDEYLTDGLTLITL
jgi:hypothetical protein